MFFLWLATRSPWYANVVRCVRITLTHPRLSACPALTIARNAWSVTPFCLAPGFATRRLWCLALAAGYASLPGCTGGSVQLPDRTTVLIHGEFVFPRLLANRVLYCNGFPCLAIASCSVFHRTATTSTTTRPAVRVGSVPRVSKS